MSVTFRLATRQDAKAFTQIERAAAELFRTATGLEWVADQEPVKSDAYLPLIAAGTVWVAEEAGIVGFLAACIEASQLHLLEVDVLPANQRKGVGRSLIQHATDKALEHKLAALTLTTFRGVAWNEPFYRSLGFEIVEGDHLCDRLRRYLAREVEAGLPPLQRCAMRRSLDHD